MRRLLTILISVALMGTLTTSVDARHRDSDDRTGRRDRPAEPTPAPTPPPATDGGGDTAVHEPGHYPPAQEGADCAASAISSTAWSVNDSNTVFVTVENHGDVTARCAVYLSARSDRGSARILPRRHSVVLEPGDSATVQFIVRPRRAGDYDVTACATATRPAEMHRADDCITTVIPAGDAPPTAIS